MGPSILQNRAALNIAAYSLGQTSLEQIFLAMASQQEEERGMARGMYLPSAGGAAAPAGAPPTGPAAVVLPPPPPGKPPVRGNVYI